MRSQKLRVDRGLDEVARTPSNYEGLFVETLSHIISGEKTPGTADKRRRGRCGLKMGGYGESHHMERWELQIS